MQARCQRRPHGARSLTVGVQRQSLVRLTAPCLRLACCHHLNACSLRHRAPVHPRYSHARAARGRLAAPPPRRSASLSHAQRTAAFARVAETRHTTQSGFWGHAHSDKNVARVRRDLPAFWSLSSHGQPFNDSRLTEGSSNHFKVVCPPTLGAPPPQPVGPATESLATLKASLQSGVAMLGGDRQMTPVAMDPEAMSTLRKCALVPRPAVGVAGCTHAAAD